MPSGTRRHHILVVDDDVALRDGVADLLRQEGCAATCVEDGEDALAALRSRPKPCLILLDLQMPFADGLSFRRQQLEDPELASIPVVIVTGYPHKKKAARRLGISDYIPKPIAPAELLRIVERYCAQSHPHAA